jgi:hypothetical protein
VKVRMEYGRRSYLPGHVTKRVWQPNSNSNAQPISWFQRTHAVNLLAAGPLCRRRLRQPLGATAVGPYLGEDLICPVTSLSGCGSRTPTQMHNQSEISLEGNFTLPLVALGFRGLMQSIFLLLGLFADAVSASPLGQHNGNTNVESCPLTSYM